MLGILTIIAKTVTHLAEGVLIKRYNSKHEGGGFIFTAMVSFGSLLFFFFYDLIRDGGNFDFRLDMLPYAIVSGILYAMSSVLTYVALAKGPFAISMLILSYSLVFSTGYGIIFLDEPVTPFSVIGILLIIISLFLIRKERAENEKKASLVWLVSIILSVVGSGMLGVVMRMQQIRFDNAVSNEYMILTLAISFALLTVIAVIRDKKRCIDILITGAPYALAAGFANGLTNLLGLVVTLLMPISVSSPTSSGIKSLFSFLSSLIIFKEKFLTRQVVGVIIGAVAVILLNI